MWAIFDLIVTDRLVSLQLYFNFLIGDIVGKGWILQHATSHDAGKVISQHLLRKVTQPGAAFTQKLHIIYLVNDVLHHWLVSATAQTDHRVFVWFHLVTNIKQFKLLHLLTFYTN